MEGRGTDPCGRFRTSRTLGNLLVSTPAFCHANPHSADLPLAPVLRSIDSARTLIPLFARLHLVQTTELFRSRH